MERSQIFEPGDLVVFDRALTYLAVKAFNDEKIPQWDTVEPHDIGIVVSVDSSDPQMVTVMFSKTFSLVVIRAPMLKHEYS